jgi:hypothetical protein
MSMRPSASGPTAGAAVAERTVEQQDTPPRVAVLLLLALIVTFGYVAFLMAGFGKGLETVGNYNVRPLSLYVYGGALLLLLQWQVIHSLGGAQLTGVRRLVSMVETIYTFVTSIFALVYMGQALFFRGSNNITQQPATYIILNAGAIIVLLMDFSYRRTKDGRAARPPVGDPALNSPFLNLALDIGGLAAFCYLAWAILWVLNALNYVTVNIHQLGLPGITYLQDLDLVLALAITAIALALTVMHGFLVNTTDAQVGDARGIFWMQLLRLARYASSQGLDSLRLVLGPLIWLIPAYSIGQFAIQTTTYFDSVATTGTQGLWGLFNPFSPNSIANYGRGLLVIALALIAVGTVIIASAVVEHNVAVFIRTLSMLRRAGQAVTLTLALFLFSLAIINAVEVIVAHAAQPMEPFQLGAATLFALILAIVPPVFARIRNGLPRRR